MKFLEEKYGISIDLQDNAPIILTIEKVSIFRDIINVLWNQKNGMYGSIIISQAEKTMKLEKEVELIINPFEISLNNKKILSYLYRELEDVAKESCYEDTLYMNQYVMQYLYKITSKVPYPLVYDEEFDINVFLKGFKLHYDESEQNFLEKFVAYIRLLHQVCGISVVICIGIKMYLDNEQLKMLYQMLLYEKVYFLDIENRFSSKIDVEKCFIFDENLCIIEL